MERTRRGVLRRITRITVTILLLTVCLLAVAAATQTGAAYAAANPSSGVRVGELLLSDYASRTDGLKFDGERLVDLFGYIANGSGRARLSDVAGKGVQTADDIRKRIDQNQDIVVAFGGQDWTVTHVTQDRDGNVIATLWLMSSSATSKWNNWEAHTPQSAYPGNMYSSSLIRAQALNSGGSGYVATQGASTLTKIAQKSTHAYAKFTMQSVKDADGNEISLTDYIVRPRQVAYQETESIRAFDATHWSTCPNEAWGTPQLESYVTDMNYSAKSHYAEWADDYLWLPSIAETGVNVASGLWRLSDSQRANTKQTWLRTGSYDYANFVYALSTTGAYSYGYTNDAYAVRPALHLNLTKAVADAATPTDVPIDHTQTYDGIAHAFVYDPTQYAIANVRATDPSGATIGADGVAVDATTGTVTVKAAGTYSVDLTLRDTGKMFWFDATGGSGTRSVKIEIAPKSLTLSLQSDVPNGIWDWTIRDPYTATLTATGIESGDTIGLSAVYAATGGASVSVAGVQTGAQIVATIDLSKIAIGKYTLSAALDNSVGQSADYSIASALTAAGMPRAFVVHAKTVDLSGAGWLHTVSDADGNPIAGQPDHAPIANNAQFVYALYGTRQQYAAYVHHMSVDASALPKNDDGNPIADIDMLTTSYNGTTYTGGYSNASGTAVNRYTTKVLLKIVDADYLFDNNQTTYELSLSWEIVKGTFDLTGVQWEYRLDNGEGGEYLPDTELEYDDGKIIRVAVKESSLPLGLTVLGGLTYQGNANVQTAVGTYTATVDTGLDYDTSLFEAPGTLQLTWEIVGKGIRTKWKSKVHNDYFVVELNIDPAYAGMVHYRYYDASNNLLGADAAGLAAMDQMIAAQGIGPSNPQNFTIEAYLDGADSGNYRLVGDVRKTVTVGLPLTQVRVDVAGSVTYDGTAHYGDNELTFTGANIRPSDYTATYYAGTDLADMSKNTKLDGAPTDAGKYVIAIEMQGTSYLLSQDVFAVEILPKQVAVPTLKAVTFNGTEYRLLDLLTGFDADVMTMDDVTAATNAGTYRATLTLSSKNYVWATADGGTGSQEYELSWTIAKAQLKEQWVGQADGKQTFVVSDKYADYVQIVYEYYDADGNVVAESDLVAGQTYKVVAKLGAASAENFEFIDANGEVTTMPSQSEAKQFVFGNDPNNPSGSGNFGIGESWFKIAILTMTVCIVLITLMLFAIWMAVLSIRRLRKNKSQQS